MVFRRSGVGMNGWQNEMADILAEVARALVRKHGERNDGILLLCSYDIGIGYDVFVGKGPRAVYASMDESDQDNIDLLAELRTVPPMSKRFEALALFVKQGQMTTELVYDEDIAPDDRALDARDEIITRFFGDVRIAYPESRGDPWDLMRAPSFRPSRTGSLEHFVERFARPSPRRKSRSERKALLLADLASTLRAETSFSPLGTLMVATVEHGYISIARFWDRGSYIACGQPNYDKYRDTLFELWRMERLSRRWDEIHYLIRGKEVRVTHLYPEDIDRDIAQSDRWSNAAQAAFGVKKVVYPHGHGSAQFILR